MYPEKDPLKNLRQNVDTTEKIRETKQRLNTPCPVSPYNMKRNREYTIQPFTYNRRNITLFLEEAKRKHIVYALLEVDVTTARNIIHHQKRQGKDISFTGWLIKCISQAAVEHRELNSYRQGRKKIIVFDDVDVPITIERTSNNETRPVPYIIRKVNKKTLEAITSEIRWAQHQNIDANTQCIGLPVHRVEWCVLHAPQFIKKAVLVILRNHGKLKKKYMGTIGVTSIGMIGNVPGWIIPLGGSLTTLIAVGSITKKPHVINDSMSIREILHVTIAVDHDLVDGGPLARFSQRFTELVEQKAFLK